MGLDVQLGVIDAGPHPADDLELCRIDAFDEFGETLIRM